MRFETRSPDDGFTLFEGGPLSISQDVAPCSVHLGHSPITRTNELHHVFPKYLQARVWGTDVVRDGTLVSVCGTGHTNVHTALAYYLKTNDWPRWCVGNTRDLAQEAVDRYAAAMEART